MSRAAVTLSLALCLASCKGQDEPPRDSSSTRLAAGFQYIRTRDGTTLSAHIAFPDESVYPQPWPVLLDYSGYDPSDPKGLPPEAALFTLQGYAVAGVNMRGTGCSGGAFDYLDDREALDGYDVVEALAAQTWSTGDVGMIGISYAGVSQLFVAKTHPPHLRAITPLSVVADTYRGALYPGGILNEGFALAWAKERDAAAKPSARPWVRERIEREGDQVCAENQKQRGPSRSLEKAIREHPFLDDTQARAAPAGFAADIDVPVFLGGAFQDEQTGGHFATMIPRFKKARVFLTNGTHTDSLGAQNLVRVAEFLDLYVAKRIPRVAARARFHVPGVLQKIFGGGRLWLEKDRFADASSYEAALAAYEREPPVRLVWENGAGRAPGEPLGTAESLFSTWPPEEARPVTLYLGPDGLLSKEASGAVAGDPPSSSAYRSEPAARSRSFFDGPPDAVGRVETQVGAFRWAPPAERLALRFTTEPLARTTAYVGGVAHLYLRSTAPDTDVEVSLSEARPDGAEVFLQSGWLRASHRALDEKASTDLSPVHTHREADAAPLREGDASLLRVPLFPFAHLLRKGSRLRLTVSAPGGNQPLWRFASLPGGAINTVDHSSSHPSRLLLAELPAALLPEVPDELAPCPALRNQPCAKMPPP